MWENQQQKYSDLLLMPEQIFHNIQQKFEQPSIAIPTARRKTKNVDQRIKRCAPWRRRQRKGTVQANYYGDSRAAALPNSI